MSSGEGTQARVEELVEELDRLKSGLEARDQFLALVSHELRSPVHALLLHLEATLLLGERQQNATEWMRGRTEKAVHRVRELSDLLDRFLDVNRIQAGRLDLDRQEVDLVTLTRESIRRMGNELAWAGCAVSLTAPAELRGHWDPTRLEAVLANLVGNARKYGAGKPIAVRLEDSGVAAHIFVEDQGPGIALEHQQRIFERFERIVGPGRPKIAGLGIGLWITRHFVEAHGGAIAVSNRPEGGAQFVVTLPR